ncbi:MAG: hypothetical protein QW315_06235, partial [Candidatus Hadarchaeum sp.]
MIEGDCILITRRKINAKEIAKDIHMGLNDLMLKEKYGFTAKQLEIILRKLLDANLITHMQLYERTMLSDTQLALAFSENKK